MGGGTGILERTYRLRNQVNVDKWIIIDPEPNPVETEAEFIKGFFPQVMPKNFEFDVLVHSHTWEHAYSSKEFVQNISEVMQSGQKMIFSVPNMKYLLENCDTSILNFEHTVLLTDDYIDFLLAKYGFEIDQKEFFENHSVMYVTTKTNNPKNEVSLKGLYKKNLSLFNKYIESHIRRMNLLNNYIQNKVEGACFLFGGHISSQFYKAFGLDISKLVSILDNDPFKQGRRVAGTSLVIQHPSVLKNYQNPTVILPSSPYKDEIKKQLLQDNQTVNIVDIDLL